MIIPDYEIAPNSCWQKAGDPNYQGNYCIYYDENNINKSIKCKECLKTFEYSTNHLGRTVTKHRKKCKPTSIGVVNDYIKLIINENGLNNVDDHINPNLNVVDNEYDNINPNENGLDHVHDNINLHVNGQNNKIITAIKPNLQQELNGIFNEFCLLKNSILNLDDDTVVEEIIIKLGFLITMIKKTDTKKRKTDNNSNFNPSKKLTTTGPIIDNNDGALEETDNGSTHTSAATLDTETAHALLSIKGESDSMSH